MAFKRIANLYVGNFDNGNDKSKGYEISGLDFSFDIERSTEWFANKARFTVYNASKNTINQILTGGSSIIFSGGYEDQKVGNIFIGQIGFVDSEKKGDDEITTICCASGRGGTYQLARVGVSISFPAGSKMVTVLDWISQFCNMAFKGRENISEIVFTNKVIHAGDVASFFRKINDCLASCGAGCYVDNNEIIVYKLFGSVSRFNYASLTFGSGLISARPARDESLNEINFRQDLAYWMGYKDMTEAQRKEVEEKIAADKLKKEELNKRDIVKFKSLLRADIMPNTEIYINNDDDIDNDYLVTKCHFVGNNFGGDFSVSGEAVK